MSDRPYTRHASAIIDGEDEGNNFIDPRIGAGTRIWHHVHVCEGAQIGRDCILGQNVYVGGEAVIGDGCKIQNNVNIYDGVELANHVFCGPSMTFTNLSTPLPRAAISRRHQLQTTKVGAHASIGAHATILCGITLGEACFVAAGATVTRDVPAYAVVAGTPARRIGWACQCGARLTLQGDEISCQAHYQLGDRLQPCGRRYRLDGPELLRLITAPNGGEG